jgi:hypothetical protein
LPQLSQKSIRMHRLDEGLSLLAFGAEFDLFFF